MSVYDNMIPYSLLADVAVPAGHTLVWRKVLSYGEVLVSSADKWNMQFHVQIKSCGGFIEFDFDTVVAEAVTMDDKMRAISETIEYKLTKETLINFSTFLRYGGYVN